MGTIFNKFFKNNSKKNNFSGIQKPIKKFDRNPRSAKIVITHKKNSPTEREILSYHNKASATDERIFYT